jgi:hypothetical protein
LVGNTHPGELETGLTQVHADSEKVLTVSLKTGTTRFVEACSYASFLEKEEPLRLTGRASPVCAWLSNFLGNPTRIDGLFGLDCS